MSAMPDRYELVVKERGAVVLKMEGKLSVVCAALAEQIKFPNFQTDSIVMERK